MIQMIVSNMQEYNMKWREKVELESTNVTKLANVEERQRLKWAGKQFVN